MHRFTHPDGRVAHVVGVDGRRYWVYTFADAEAYRTSQAQIASAALVGTPNQEDMQAVLPGFEYTGDDGLPELPSVPDSVTAWQMRRWLIANGIGMDDVDAAIAAIEDPAMRAAAQVDWEYAPYVERTHPMLAAMAVILGIDDIDAAFIAAEKITGTP